MFKKTYNELHNGVTAQKFKLALSIMYIAPYISRLLSY